MYVIRNKKCNKVLSTNDTISEAMESLKDLIINDMKCNKMFLDESVNNFTLTQEFDNYDDVINYRIDCEYNPDTILVYNNDTGRLKDFIYI